MPRTWTQSKIDEVVSSLPVANDAAEKARIAQLVQDMRVRDTTRWPLPSTGKCFRPEHLEAGETSNGQCKMCIVAYNHDFDRTPYGFVTRILQAAKGRDKKFNSSLMTLSDEDVITLVIRQRGLCGISGLRLIFAVGCAWKASLEKINPKGGYTLDNVMLICVEFNSTTNQRGKGGKRPFSRGAQWTREKFVEWYAYLLASRVQKE